MKYTVPPPTPAGLKQSAWIQSYADLWATLGLDKTRHEGCIRALQAWPAKGHLNPLICAKRDLDDLTSS